MRKSIPNELRKIVAPIRKQLVEKYEDANLNCKCAIASFLVWEALKRENYNPLFVLHNGMKHENSPCRYTSHCFVICDGYLVDLTATQFLTVPKVWVRKHTSERYWIITQTANSHNKIKKLLKQWPKEQKPEIFT